MKSHQNNKNYSSSLPVPFYTNLRKIPDLQINDYIASGSFGSVHYTQCLQYGKCAGKFIPIHFIEDNGIESYIRREIEISKNLRHPNIVRTFDATVIDFTKEFIDKNPHANHDPNTEGDCLVILMESVTGGDLFEKVRKSRRLEQNLARRLFQQLVSALMYLHSHNYIHRDLKAENLLLTSTQGTPELKVCDFGLCGKIVSDREKDSVTGEAKAVLMRTLAGSLEYQAPEVLDDEGGYVGFTCDVWSSAVVLYLMLLGSFPFSGKDDDEIVKKIHLGKFDETSLPPSAVDLIKSMLQVNIHKRATFHDVVRHPWFQLGLTKSVLDDLETRAEAIYLNEKFSPKSTDLLLETWRRNQQQQKEQKTEQSLQLQQSDSQQLLAATGTIIEPKQELIIDDEDMKSTTNRNEGSYNNLAASDSLRNANSLSIASPLSTSVANAEAPNNNNNNNNNKRNSIGEIIEQTQVEETEVQEEEEEEEDGIEDVVEEEEEEAEQDEDDDEDLPEEFGADINEDASSKVGISPKLSAANLRRNSKMQEQLEQQELQKEKSLSPTTLTPPVAHASFSRVNEFVASQQQIEETERDAPIIAVEKIKKSSSFVNKNSTKTSQEPVADAIENNNNNEDDDDLHETVNDQTEDFKIDDENEEKEEEQEEEVPQPIPDDENITVQQEQEQEQDDVIIKEQLEHTQPQLQEQQQEHLQQQQLEQQQEEIVLVVTQENQQQVIDEESQQEERPQPAQEQDETDHDIPVRPVSRFEQYDDDNDDQEQEQESKPIEEKETEATDEKEHEVAVVEVSNQQEEQEQENTAASFNLDATIQQQQAETEVKEEEHKEETQKEEEQHQAEEPAQNNETIANNNEEEQPEPSSPSLSEEQLSLLTSICRAYQTRRSLNQLRHLINSESSNRLLLFQQEHDSFFSTLLFPFTSQLQEFTERNIIELEQIEESSFVGFSLVVDFEHFNFIQNCRVETLATFPFLHTYSVQYQEIQQRSQIEQDMTLHFTITFQEQFDRIKLEHHLLHEELIGNVFQNTAQFLKVQKVIEKTWNDQNSDREKLASIELFWLDQIWADFVSAELRVLGHRWETERSRLISNEYYYELHQNLLSDFYIEDQMNSICTDYFINTLEVQMRKSIVKEEDRLWEARIAAPTRAFSLDFFTAVMAHGDIVKPRRGMRKIANSKRSSGAAVSNKKKTHYYPGEEDEEDDGETASNATGNEDDDEDDERFPHHQNNNQDFTFTDKTFFSDDDNSTSRDLPLYDDQEDNYEDGATPKHEVRSIQNSSGSAAAAALTIKSGSRKTSSVAAHYPSPISPSNQKRQQQQQKSTNIRKPPVMAVATDMQRIALECEEMRERVQFLIEGPRRERIELRWQQTLHKEIIPARELGTIQLVEQEKRRQLQQQTRQMHAFLLSDSVISHVEYYGREELLKNKFFRGQFDILMKMESAQRRIIKQQVENNSLMKFLAIEHEERKIREAITAEAEVGFIGAFLLARRIEARDRLWEHQQRLEWKNLVENELLERDCVEMFLALRLIQSCGRALSSRRKLGVRSGVQRNAAMLLQRVGRGWRARSRLVAQAIHERERERLSVFEVRHRETGLKLEAADRQRLQFFISASLSKYWHICGVREQEQMKKRKMVEKRRREIQEERMRMEKEQQAADNEEIIMLSSVTNNHDEGKRRIDEDYEKEVVFNQQKQEPLIDVFGASINPNNTSNSTTNFHLRPAPASTQHDPAFSSSRNDQAAGRSSSTASFHPPNLSQRKETGIFYQRPQRPQSAQPNNKNTARNSSFTTNNSNNNRPASASTPNHIPRAPSTTTKRPVSAATSTRNNNTTNTPNKSSPTRFSSISLTTMKEPSKPEWRCASLYPSSKALPPWMGAAWGKKGMF